MNSGYDNFRYEEVGEGHKVKRDTLCKMICGIAVLISIAFAVLMWFFPSVVINGTCYGYNRLFDQSLKCPVTKCGPSEWEWKAPTTTSDRVCYPLEICTDCQYEVVSPTATSNRVCSTRTEDLPTMPYYDGQCVSYEGYCLGSVPYVSSQSNDYCQTNDYCKQMGYQSQHSYDYAPLHWNDRNCCINFYSGNIDCPCKTGFIKDIKCNVKCNKPLR